MCKEKEQKAEVSEESEGRTWRNRKGVEDAGAER